jgi:hypothetical protein
MARPGLEPGTPRFSVVHVVRPRMAESLEIMRFRSGCRAHPMFAICGYLSPFVGMADAPGPSWTRAVRAKPGGRARAWHGPVGRAHSLFRGGGHELGGDADDCVSSGVITSPPAGGTTAARRERSRSAESGNEGWIAGAPVSVADSCADSAQRPASIRRQLDRGSALDRSTGLTLSGALSLQTGATVGTETMSLSTARAVSI